MRAIKEILETAQTIAVVGCSDKPWRDSYMIAAFLKEQGYTVYPVNPTITEALGVVAWPSVAAIPDHIDIVDVFRRGEHLMAAAEDAIAAGAGALWMQSGLRHAEAEERARAAGLDVVADRCIAVEYRLERVTHRGQGRGAAGIGSDSF